MTTTWGAHLRRLTSVPPIALGGAEARPVAPGSGFTLSKR